MKTAKRAKSGHGAYPREYFLCQSHSFEADGEQSFQSDILGSTICLRHFTRVHKNSQAGEGGASPYAFPKGKGEPSQPLLRREFRVTSALCMAIVLSLGAPIGYKKPVNWDNEPPLYRTLFAFLGAMIGGFMVWMIGGRELHVVPVGVSYGDLAAIALTAVTVLLAVFALACAFAALYGYREFMKRSAAVAASVAEKKTEEAVQVAVEAYLNLHLDRDLTRRAQTIATRVITPEYLQERIIEQIGVVALGNMRDEKLDAAAALDAVASDDDDLAQLDRDAAEEDADHEEGSGAQ